MEYSEDDKLRFKLSAVQLLLQTTRLQENIFLLFDEIREKGH